MKKNCAILLFGWLILPLHTSFAHQNSGQSTKDLDNQDVVNMVKTGLSPEVVIAKIKTASNHFDTSPSALSDLKSSGVPDQIILEMVSHASTSKDQMSKPQALQNAPVETNYAYLAVYRSRRFTGSALAPSIFVDEKQVVRVGNGRHCLIKLTPGTHSIRSDDKSSAISIDAKVGQNYYVRVEEATGFWKGHGKLTLVAPEQGEPEFKLEKPVEQDRILAKEMLVAESETPEASKK